MEVNLHLVLCVPQDLHRKQMDQRRAHVQTIFKVWARDSGLEIVDLSPPTKGLRNWKKLEGSRRRESCREGQQERSSVLHSRR